MFFLDKTVIGENCKPLNVFGVSTHAELMVGEPKHYITCLHVRNNNEFKQQVDGSSCIPAPDIETPVRLQLCGCGTLTFNRCLHRFHILNSCYYIKVFVPLFPPKFEGDNPGRQMQGDKFPSAWIVIYLVISTIHLKYFISASNWWAVVQTYIQVSPPSECLKEMTAIFHKFCCDQWFYHIAP